MMGCSSKPSIAEDVFGSEWVVNLHREEVFFVWGVSKSKKHIKVSTDFPQKLICCQQKSWKLLFERNHGKSSVDLKKHMENHCLQWQFQKISQCQGLQILSRQIWNCDEVSSRHGLLHEFDDDQGSNIGILKR